jgi:hypothetical protein
MWLQTASEFTTHVRIFGQHTITARDVSYETAERAGAELHGPKRISQANNHDEEHCSAPCVPVSMTKIPPSGREFSTEPNGPFELR